MPGHYSHADTNILSSSHKPHREAPIVPRTQKQHQHQHQHHHHQKPLPDLPQHKASISLPIQSPDPLPESSPDEPTARSQARPRAQLRSGARAYSHHAHRVQTIVEPDVQILAEPPLDGSGGSSPETLAESPVDSPILPGLEHSISRTGSSSNSSMGSPVSTLIEPCDKLYYGDDDGDEESQGTPFEERFENLLASPHEEEQAPRFLYPFARPSWTPTPLLTPAEAEKIQELWRPSKPAKKPAATPTPILGSPTLQSPDNPWSPRDAICSRAKLTPPARPNAIAPGRRSFSSHAKIVPPSNELSSDQESPILNVSPVPPQPFLRQSEVEAQPPSYEELEAELDHTNPLHAHPITSPTFGQTNFGHPEKPPLEQLTHNQVETYPGLGLEVQPCRVNPDLTLDTTLTPPPSDNSNTPSVASPSYHALHPPHQRPPPPKSTASEPNSKWFHHLGQKTSTGINNLAHKIGGTGFLPDTLEVECEKAAIILRTFCRHGVYADSSNKTEENSVPTSPSNSKDHSAPATPAHRFKSLVTIPTGVIEKAVGLAIFTTFRAGLNFQGATGSGILVSRLHDGSWSPPSAIQLHSFGGGIVAGINVYDCVCVINTQEALRAFMDTRVSLGADVAIAAGPWGAGGAVDWGAVKDKHHEPSPAATLGSSPSLEAKSPSTTKTDKHGGKKKYSPHVFSYVQSRGFYAGFAYDSTVIHQRKRANAAFYGEGATCEKILRGKQPAPDGVPSLQTLFDVLRGAEGMLTPSADGPLSCPDPDPSEESGMDTIAMRLKPRIPPPMNQSELPRSYSQVSTLDSMEFPAEESITMPARQDMPPLPQHRKAKVPNGDGGGGADSSQSTTPGSATSDGVVIKSGRAKKKAAAPKKKPNALYPSDFSMF